MIAQLSGKLVDKQLESIIIDVNGVGYEVEAPLSVFYDLPENGKPVVLLTHLSVTDTAHTLYGFASEAERTLFRQLLKISGIGAKLALTILSGASGSELAQYVADRDTAALTRLPGIGKKTAERLIMEMRDKVDHVGAPSLPGQVVSVDASARSEAFDALVTLGYKANEVNKLLGKLDIEDDSAEDIIRKALKQAAL